MTHSRRTFGLPAMRAMLGALATLAVSGAEAQWFPPVGAASPAEIAERLRAQGYALTGPLLRKDTIYLTDVTVGPGGHERLVIDAWSGEILQRFVGRPGAWKQGAGGYVIERGEFDSPPPLAPPPARDFYYGQGGGNFAYGELPGARFPEAVGPIGPPEAKSKTKPRPAGATRKPADSKPATAAMSPGQQAAPPAGAASQTANDNSGAAAPPPAAAGAAAAAPPSAPAAKLDAPSSPASPQGTAPQAPPSASMAQTQRKEEAPPARSEPASAPGPKSTDKSKVNDVPVNTLE